MRIQVKNSDNACICPHSKALHVPGLTVVVVGVGIVVLFWTAVEGDEVVLNNLVVVAVAVVTVDLGVIVDNDCVTVVL